VKLSQSQCLAVAGGERVSEEVGFYKIPSSSSTKDFVLSRLLSNK
jgi:hypothetical protein